MYLLTEHIPQELVDQTVELITFLDKPTKEWAKMDLFLEQQLLKCERLMVEYPDNDILKENHAQILVMAMTFRLGTLL